MRVASGTCASRATLMIFRGCEARRRAGRGAGRGSCAPAGGSWRTPWRPCPRSRPKSAAILQAGPAATRSRVDSDHACSVLPPRLLDGPQVAREARRAGADRRRPRTRRTASLRGSRGAGTRRESCARGGAASTPRAGSRPCARTTRARSRPSGSKRRFSTLATSRSQVALAGADVVLLAEPVEVLALGRGRSPRRRRPRRSPRSSSP